MESLIIILITIISGNLILRAITKEIIYHYSKVSYRKHIAAEEIANQLLMLNGITDIQITRISGNFNSHYNTQKRLLVLSNLESR